MQRLLGAGAGLLLAAAAVIPTVPPVSRVVTISALQVNCDVADIDAPLSAEEQTALDLINNFRAENGLGPVSVDGALTRAARWKAAAMALGAPFEHDDPDRPMEQRLTDCGYTRPEFVEDLAAGPESPADALALWQSSPIHRANLLYEPGQTIGLARRHGPAPYEWYWCLVIGV